MTEKTEELSDRTYYLEMNAVITEVRETGFALQKLSGGLDYVKHEDKYCTAELTYGGGTFSFRSNEFSVGDHVVIRVTPRNPLGVSDS